MNIVVFGANGRVGSRVVPLLLEGNHNVVAFVRSAHFLASHDNLEIIEGNVKNKRDVSAALFNQDAVISCLSSWGADTKDVLTVGISNILPAMKKHDIKRIVSLTGHEARASTDKKGRLNHLTHPLFKFFAGNILEDGEAHIRMLEASGLDWTVIRSPIMRDQHNAGYKLVTHRPRPWETVKRQLVAQAIVDELEAKSWVGKSPFIVGI